MPPPRLELVDQALDGVPLLVELGVVVDGASPFAALRLPVGGLVPFLRDDGLDAAPAQVGALLRDEYALSPATASGLVRGRPTGPRTRIFPSTGMNCGLSARSRRTPTTGTCGRRRDGPLTSARPVSAPPERPSAGSCAGAGRVAARPARDRHHRPARFVPRDRPLLTWPPPLRRQPSPKRRARPGSCASRRHRDGPARWWSRY